VKESDDPPAKEPGASPLWVLHPIRLQFLHLSKVNFEARSIPANLEEEEWAKAGSARWRVGISTNIDETRAVVVASLECCFEEPPGGEEEKPKKPKAGPKGASEEEARPYSFEVQATAGFTFDQEEIPLEEVREWCQKGSFFIFVPYFRSIIANITRESGFPEVLLPLLQVPTFRPPMKKTPTEGKVRPEQKDVRPKDEV